MDNLTLEEYKEIFKDIKTVGKCPICLELVQPPVRLCKNGHLMCEKCFNASKTLVCCTLCASKFSKIKPIDINNLLNVIPRPCEYECGYIVKNLLQNHHKYWCEKRLVECLHSLQQEGNVRRCTEVGNFKYLRKHLENCHNLLIVNNNPKNIKIICKRSINTHIIFPLEFQGHLLWNHIKIDIEKKKLLITLQTCPSTKEELDQIYIYKIKSCKGNSEFTYTQRVCNDYDDANNSLKKENCISIPFFMCEFMFYEKGSLTYKLEIEQFQPDNSTEQQKIKVTEHVQYSIIRRLCNSNLFQIVFFSALVFTLFCCNLHTYVNEIANEENDDTNIADEVYDDTDIADDVFEHYLQTFIRKIIEFYNYVLDFIEETLVILWKEIDS